MRRQVGSAVAWSACLATVGLAGWTVALIWLNRSIFGSDQLSQSVGAATQAVAGIGFAVVGALIASRRRNAVGWLMCAVGLGLVLFPFGEHYVLRGTVTAPGSLPAVAWVAWVRGWATFIPLAAVPLLLLLFPDGHVPSPRWRIPKWIVLGGSILFLGGQAFQPGELQGTFTNYGVTLENPVGIGSSGGSWVVFILMGLVWGIAAAACLGAPLRRYRRASGVERLQLKWVAYAAVAAAATGIVGLAAGSAGGVFGVVPMIVFLLVIGFGIPAAIAVAVFRYHLYDLGRLVNRTIVYGLLTALLAGIYVGGVVGLGAIARSLGGGNDNSVVIAGSTLVVAAMFRPGRRTIQRLIDRRFYRRRYDATRTMAEFTARLREEVDLETVADDLMAVVQRTMQPARVSLWLRPPG
jgi:MFS family permease